MKKLLSSLLTLSAIVCFGDVLWEKKIANPVNQTAYYSNNGAVDLSKLAQPGKIKITVRASGDVKFGCKFRIHPQIGKPEFKTIFWNRQLIAAAKDFSAVSTFDIDHDLIKKVEIYTYNLKKSGNFKIESFKIETAPKTKTIIVPAEKTYTEFDYDPGFFPLGSYLYFYSKKYAEENYAAPRGLSIEQYVDTAFADMKAHGCNCVYIANLSDDPDFFKFVCKTAAKHGLKVFFQGTRDLYIRTEKDWAYYNKVTVPAIKKYLHLYNDIPNLAGYSGKEEVQPVGDAIAIMKAGRKLGKEQMPKVPVFTLHNNIVAMRQDIEEDIPEWFGFDRYRFRMVMDSKGNYVISTPSDMVRLINREIGEAYNVAASKKRPLIYVGQAYKCYHITKSKRFSKATGYREIEPGVWKGYFRYMPKNGMHLQFWIAVSRGCRGFLLYHYQSLKNGNNLERRYEENLVDVNGKESWFWKETGDCFKQNAVLLPLFQKWCREGKPAAVSPTADVMVNTFILPGFKGRFVLPLNTLIATWDKTNPYRTNANTQLYSDDENLQGFTWAKERKIKLNLAAKGELRDLLTGKVVNPAEIILPPGQGRVFFQGSKAEFDAVKKHFKF